MFMPGSPPLPALAVLGAEGFTGPAPALNLRSMEDSGVESTQTSDESLMLVWVGGDVTAFEQLYSRHRGRLYGFLLRQLRDQALAEEFFQDVWQRVVAARTGWKPEAAFATWLYRIAHNRLADHWRARQYRPPAPSDGDERAARIPDPDTPERTLSEFQQRRRLQLALDAQADAREVSIRY